MLSTQIQIYNGVTDRKGNVITVESALNRIANGTHKAEIEKIRKHFIPIRDAAKKTFEIQKNKNVQQWNDYLDTLKQLRKFELIYEKDKSVKSEMDKWKKILEDILNIEFIKNTIPLYVDYLNKKQNTDDYKSKISAVTWSGTFETRNTKSLIEYSQIICIDIDKLEPRILQTTKERICTSQRTFACFISPSGNGLKVLVKVAHNADLHNDFFLVAEKWLNNYLHDKIVDKSGKDICRLCFLSHDEKIYINTKSDVIDETFLSKTEKKVQKKSTTKTTDQLLDEVRIFTNNKATYVDGDRNNYVHLFACNANRKGISFSDTFEFCNYNFTDLDAKELQATVKSAYDHNTLEHGKYSNLNDYKPGAEKKPVKTAAKHTVQNESDDTKFNDEVKFWYEEINDKTNKKTIKFSYDDGTRFLEQNGYYKIPMDNNNYQFIRVKNNIVDIVKERNMREFMLEYLNSDFWDLKPVREMFKRGAKMYSATHYLECLPFYYPKFKKDTEDKAHIYFKNCHLEISADNITKSNYSNISGNIWSKQIIDFELNFGEYENCYYDAFLQRAILAREVTKEKPMNEIETQKMRSVSSTIGYLLHKYKDSANPKAIVGVDQKLRDGKEDNGGTGKSMFAKAISKMLHTCTLDGKNFKFDSPYPFEKVNLDHSLINFNDVQKNFDFERLYGLLTEEFTYSKKYIDAITIPFEDSPKFYISTNRTIKGSGNSVTRRQHIIEFSSYFNAERTPQKEFGHMFFYHWNAHDWNQFYLFMINCIKFYLKNGLVAFPLENYVINKLIDGAGEEFVDYMHENVLEKLQLQSKFVVKELYNNYITAVRGSFREKTVQNTFTKNVRQWCVVNDLELNAHCNGDRDRSNSVDYWTFTNKID